MIFKWDGKEPLTKELALLMVYDIWRWLADDPSRHAKAWPGWEHFAECLHDCACCEYGKRQVGAERRCEVCPLIETWGKSGNTYPWNKYPCMGLDSPCYGYYNARTESDKRKYATIVAIAARKAYFLEVGHK